MKPLIRALCIISVICCTLPLYAETTTRLETGARAVFADDEGGLQQYYKGFVLGRVSSDSTDLQLAFSRLQHYTITDELGTERMIDLNQPEVSAAYLYGDFAGIAASYSWTGGEAAYSAHRTETTLTLVPGKATIGLRGLLRKVTYDYHGSITYHRLSGELSFGYDATDRVSFDSGYTADYTDYRTFGYTLTEHRLRAGLIILAADWAYLFAGAGAGRDSDDTTALIGDAGFSVRLADHIKLTGTYCCTAYIASSTSGTGGSGRSGRSSASSETDTDIVHTGSFGISLYW